MLATLGVAAFFRWRWGWLLVSPVCFFLSLAAYQSYLAVAAALLILACLCAVLRGERTASVWLTGVRACASLLLGLALYALVLRVVLSAWGLTASQDYNGVGRVGMVPLDQIASLLETTYLTPLRYLFDPTSPGCDSVACAGHPRLAQLAAARVCRCAAGAPAQARASGAVLTALFLLGRVSAGCEILWSLQAQGIVNG